MLPVACDRFARDKEGTAALLVCRRPMRCREGSAFSASMRLLPSPLILVLGMKTARCRSDCREWRFVLRDGA